MDKIYNYYALTAAIFNEDLTCEDAISKFSKSNESRPVKKEKSDIYDKVPVMIYLKEKRGKSYKFIAKLFGITDDMVYTRIRRYKGKIK